jgi:hypothetical protein
MFRFDCCSTACRHDACRFIDDKDLFQKIYAKMLAKRQVACQITSISIFGPVSARIKHTGTA